MRRAWGLSALAVASLVAGCSVESTDPGDGADAFAVAACMNFVEVFVRTNSGEIGTAEGIEKIKQARDLAGFAAGRDGQYEPLADELSAMYDAIGVSDSGLSAALIGVQEECDPLLPR
jgi:hypothetical protein